ncbi:MAG TPA: ATP-binding protein [Candidatus Wunengus sp. YC60]|uniref:ATP-binding protein n=1 Tax=Candidatus Wunengus sp. YC60 TaxID=3367697 RepID=UPI0040289C38
MLASQIIFIFIFLLIAGLGVFVLLRNPANTINKRFCIFALAISLWIFFIFFLLQTTEPGLAAFRLKLVFCAAMFIPSTFFFFSSVFPDRVEMPVNRYLSIFFFAISFLLLFFSPYIVVSVSFVKQLPQARYGWLFLVFWFYFIACMGYSLYILYRKSIRYYGIKKLQVQYLYLGVAASVLLGVITNFLLPAIGIWQVEMFVPLVSVPIPIAVAYAIVKYHLMDISIVIKRSTVYAALSIVLSITYFTVGLIMSSIIPVSEYKETITNMISAIVMVLIFVPARELIQHVIEKTLFHTRYSHPKILSDSTAMFSSIHDLNGLLQYAIQHLYDSVGIDKICILLKDEKTQHYSQKAAINFPSDSNLFLLSHDAIVTWLYRNRTVLSNDQLNRFANNKFEHMLEDTLASLNVDSCIPVFQENDLFGIILLGRKVNKKVFTQEDIQMFLAFSGQLAMAARNARLYLGLKEAKTYRDNILQSLKSGVIVVDTNEEVTLINNEAKRILGLKGTSTSEKILKSLGKDTHQLLKRTLNSNEEYPNLETFVDRKSKRVPCGVTITKLKTEDGQELGALMILTDLTELKLLQTEKQHADRLAYLGVLAANIAHEIKNPLVAINTYFQLLPQKKNDHEFHNGFQKIALKEIGRINRIIEDMLNLAKPSEPLMQPIDPHNTILDTLNFLRNTVAEKGVEITTVLEEKRCAIIADEDKIKQVLLNILQNSLDALPRNGSIKVSTSFMDNLSEFRRMAKLNPNSIFFSFASPFSLDSNDTQYFVIKISDNGEGIPAEKISHIFEPFFTNKDKGTGLGLSMVYRIIKDHEGGIYIESREGTGTDFYISLPLNRTNINTITKSLQKTAEIPSSL